VGHVFGFIMWTGGLMALLHILRAHAEAGGEAGSAFTKLERGTGIFLDMGATLAIVFGVLLLVLPAGGTSVFKAGGFFHAKLTFVAVLIANHVLVRRLIRIARQGEARAPAGWQLPSCVVSVLAILIAILAKPF